MTKYGQEGTEPSTVVPQWAVSSLSVEFTDIEPMSFMLSFLAHDACNGAVYSSVFLILAEPWWQYNGDAVCSSLKPCGSQSAGDMATGRVDCQCGLCVVRNCQVPCVSDLSHFTSSRVNDPAVDKQSAVNDWQFLWQLILQ